MGDDSADDQSAPPRVDFAGINALSSRPAGYAVALKCLQIQAEAEDADPSLRSDKGTVLHDDAWSWYQGALGEMHVGGLLRSLGPEWFVRHSIPIGADTKDVDHLVIGPVGVFAINTKHHEGQSVWVGDHVLRVNNGNTRHLKAAHSDALDVARRLASRVGFPVPVTPVIAVLNARALVDRRALENRSVVVVDAGDLVARLQAQPPVFSAAELELLKLTAEEPTTWHVDPRAADTLRVMQRFDRLVARVGPPRPHAEPPRAAAVSQPPRRRPTARKGRAARAPSRGIVQLWVATVFIVAAILIFRGMANQPCSSPTACVLPGLYLAWRPLLLLLGFVAVARAVVVTALRAMRSSALTRRPGRRR